MSAEHRRGAAERAVALEHQHALALLGAERAGGQAADQGEATRLTSYADAVDGPRAAWS